MVLGQNKHSGWGGAHHPQEALSLLPFAHSPQLMQWQYELEQVFRGDSPALRPKYPQAQQFRRMMHSLVYGRENCYQDSYQSCQQSPCYPDILLVLKPTCRICHNHICEVALLPVILHFLRDPSSYGFTSIWNRIPERGCHR